MSFQFVISVKINKILWGFFSFFFFFLSWTIQNIRALDLN